MTISLNDFVESGKYAGSNCASPYNNYWGTAVKMLNQAEYTPPFYLYNQRRAIRDRYRQQMHRAAPEDKKNYGIFFVIVGVIALALLFIIVMKERGK